MRIPLTRPAPPRLSEATALLSGIEDRGIFTNFGPVNAAFEADMIEQVFSGQGSCTTVCNATLGLMLAIRSVTLTRQQGRRNYALMPSFTFAAAAHAAMWCGLTPLFCDIDPDNWAADPQAEEAMLEAHGQDIALLMPYATFGYDIDLARYERLSKKFNVPVVVDAASSLGTVSADGAGFGTGSAIPMVFSMHATKSFAAGEGGLIYSTDKTLIDTIKTMSNFGFGAPRTATMPGLNAKMSEVAALLGRLRLDGFLEIIERRQALVDIYRRFLPELQFQAAGPARQAHQFASALLPAFLAPQREQIQRALAQDGIGLAAYFSPHLAQQAYFLETCEAGTQFVADDVAARIISLPLYDSMTDDEVLEVVAALQNAMRAAAAGPPALLVEMAGD